MALLPGFPGAWNSATHSTTPGFTASRRAAHTSVVGAVSSNSPSAFRRRPTCIESERVRLASCSDCSVNTRSMASRSSNSTVSSLPSSTVSRSASARNVTSEMIPSRGAGAANSAGTIASSSANSAAARCGMSTDVIGWGCVFVTGPPLLAAARKSATASRLSDQYPRRRHRSPVVSRLPASRSVGRTERPAACREWGPTPTDRRRPTPDVCGPTRRRNL